MDKKQLRELIEVTLKEMGYYSEDAVNLLMGTAAQESHLGVYIRQLGSGPALGIFQMEPATFEDIIDNWLYYKPDLKKKIEGICNVKRLTPTTLMYNLKVAICFTRMHYLRKPGRIPSTIDGMATYWKNHYNTWMGKGTVEEFIYNYETLVL